jgi:hypothetical protein
MGEKGYRAVGMGRRGYEEVGGGGGGGGGEGWVGNTNALFICYLLSRIGDVRAEIQENIHRLLYGGGGRGELR